MPTYNYKCIQCRKTFSIKQSIKDEPLEKCIKCEGKVNRIISGITGLIFKVSGFYLTDYGRNSKKINVKSEAGKKPKKDKKDKKEKLNK